MPVNNLIKHYTSLCQYEQCLETHDETLVDACSLESVYHSPRGPRENWKHVRGGSPVDVVAVVMAIVMAVRGGASVEDVEGDIARRGSKHHQMTLTQGRVVATVTEGTLLYSGGGGGVGGWERERMSQGAFRCATGRLEIWPPKEITILQHLDKYIGHIC